MQQWEMHIHNCPVANYAPTEVCEYVAIKWVISWDKELINAVPQTAAPITLSRQIYRRKKVMRRKKKKIQDDLVS